MPEGPHSTRSTSIVLVGDFNPAILHPQWFLQEGLVREDEFSTNQPALVSNDVSVAQGRTVAYEALRNRCTFSSTPDNPTPDTVRDLAVGVFSLLSYTPVRQAGLNYGWHFGPEEVAWVDLVPSVVDLQHFEEVLDEPRGAMIELHSLRSDDYQGHISTQLQPSVVLEGGVFLNVNSHIDFFQPGSERTTDAQAFVEAVSDVWDDARATAEQIARWVVDGC